MSLLQNRNDDTRISSFVKTNSLIQKSPFYGGEGGNLKMNRENLKMNREVKSENEQGSKKQQKSLIKGALKQTCKSGQKKNQKHSESKRTQVL